MKNQTIYPVKLSLASELAGKGVIDQIQLVATEPQITRKPRVWEVTLTTRFGDMLKLSTSYRNKAFNRPKAYPALEEARDELLRYGMWNEDKVQIIS